VGDDAHMSAVLLRNSNVLNLQDRARTNFSLFPDALKGNIWALCLMKAGEDVLL